MKKIIETDQAPAAIGPYSQAVETSGALFVSGQLPVDPVDGSIPDGVGAQTERALQNIAAILAKAEYTFHDVVRCTVLLTDMNEFDAMNEVYARYFTSKMPSRICYQVSRLPKGVSVEIDAIAIK